MGFRMLPLIDVCETITDGSHYSPQSEPDSGYYMASVRDMRDFGFDFSDCKTISTNDYEIMQRNGCCPKRGDILIGKDGANFYMDAFIFEQDEQPAILSSIAIIRPNRHIVIPEFLFAYLRTPSVIADVRANYRSGSAIPRIVLKDFKRLPVWVPDLDTQARIARIYASFNQLIHINQQTNDYLLELTRLQIKEYLSQTEDTSFVSVRDYVVSMSNGATPSRKNAAFWDDGNIPWVKTSEVNNGLILETEEHVTQSAVEKTSIRLLPVNTVVMALYGRGTAGRLGILQIEATTNQACTAMVCDSSIEAFYLFITLQGMYRQIDNMTRGSVQQNLSKDLVAEIQIPSIPVGVLKEMGLEQYYSQIVINERENSKLAAMRDVLLPKLMSGEIDVSRVALPTQPNNHLCGKEVADDHAARQVL